MKKNIIAILLILLLVGCSSNSYSKLNYEKLTKKIDDKESFILLINDQSEEGNLLKNTLNKVLKANNLKAYELNPNKVSADEKNELRTSFSYENISIIFFKDGINPSKLSHITDELTTETEITNHLKNLGFINSEK